uniref:leucine-rich repeat extensin-like protein 3 isoform X2 n=1 Tax=Oncorhynchus gorbuscha TaxID=8017 RepID=UPI001EAECC48|nr:leucine-rich repeat extensin-like protein 3 isoform X2 [Oncorhynchus gorbuscha]
MYFNRTGLPYSSSAEVLNGKGSTPANRIRTEVEYIRLRDQHMMSSFTREKLSLHLRRRMGVFVSRVRATELMANLPCLTPSDKEEIQAKKDFSGNYAAMQILLDYVQKRMNWPEELMSALELLEHQDLADELRAEWNKHNQNSQPAPPEASLPPEVAPEVLPSPVVAAHPEAPPSSVPEAPMAGSSSKHAPKAAVSPEIASEAAPSPVAAPQAEPQAAPPSPVSVEEPTVISQPPVSSQPGSVETVSLEDNLCHSDAPTQRALSETTPTLSGSHLIPVVSEITPTFPVSHLALSQTESTPTPAALATFQSPERRPVQDTSPHTVKVPTFHQEAVENSDPTQVTEDEQHTEPSQSQHFSPAAAPADTSMNEDEVNFSKPEVLRSEVMDSQPYSGDSTRLQRSVSDLVLATADVNSRVAIPDPVTTSTPLPCQENGVPEEIIEPLSHNEPQEDTYESSCLSSLGDQEVLLNVVHVSEDASILNNDGQTPSMLGFVVHVSEEPPIWNQDGQTQSMLGNNDVGVSGTPLPVQNHNSQSQITPLSGSNALDLSSGPNQHGQCEITPLSESNALDLSSGPNQHGQSQITPLSGSNALDLSSGPNQHGQSDDR